MSPYLSAILLAGVALLQTTVAPRLALAGAHPNLMLLTVVSWSLLRGANEGIRWGFMGGVMLDLLSGGPLGISALTMTLVSYLTGVGEINIFRANFLLPGGTIVLATGAYNALFLLLLQTLGRPIIWEVALTRVILPAIFLNMLVMPLAYLPLRRLHRRIGQPEMHW